MVAAKLGTSILVKLKCLKFVQTTHDVITIIHSRKSGVWEITCPKREALDNVLLDCSTRCVDVVEETFEHAKEH